MLETNESGECPRCVCYLIPERLKLSARGYHRVLRVARTLADLDASDAIGRVHLAEALSYRRIAFGWDVVAR